MLLPKRVKYRRVHRGRMKGKASRGNTVTYGDWGLQATEPSWITSNQIEAARIAMTRHTKRGGRSGSRSSPTSPSLRSPPRPAWVPVRVPPSTGWPWVKPGRVMFEIAGVSEEVAREALRLASHKLPVKCKIVKREETEKGG